MKPLFAIRSSWFAIRCSLFAKDRDATISGEKRIAKGEQRKGEE